mgnify:CR=1 FL=1
MKKTLIRAVSFLVTLSLLTGLLAPLAGRRVRGGHLPVHRRQVRPAHRYGHRAGPLRAGGRRAALPRQHHQDYDRPAHPRGRGPGGVGPERRHHHGRCRLADLTPDSSTAGLQAGEEITVRNLLYCLLLASANEAANALAIAVAGDIPTFVEQMNQRAQELGMSGTHFVNPHGLHSDDHYTTARDIFKMAKQAMTHATFREIVSTGTIPSLPPTSPGSGRCTTPTPCSPPPSIRGTPTAVPSASKPAAPARRATASPPPWR